MDSAPAADAKPKVASWVRKGMRVRLLATQGEASAGVRTAVVSAARDPTAVTLRHDGSGAVLTAREEELLPSVPSVGGSAILLSGEHAGEVGRVTAVSLGAQGRATVRLDVGEVECHLLDVSEWAQGSSGAGGGGGGRAPSFVDGFGGILSDSYAWAGGGLDEGW